MKECSSLFQPGAPSRELFEALTPFPFDRITLDSVQNILLYVLDRTWFTLLAFHLTFPSGSCLFSTRLDSESNGLQPSLIHSSWASPPWACDLNHFKTYVSSIRGFKSCTLLIQQWFDPPHDITSHSWTCARLNASTLLFTLAVVHWHLSHHLPLTFA